MLMSESARSLGRLKTQYVELGLKSEISLPIWAAVESQHVGDFPGVDQALRQSGGHPVDDVDAGIIFAQGSDLPHFVQSQTVIEQIVVVFMADEVVSDLEKPLVAVAKHQPG